MKKSLSLLISLSLFLVSWPAGAQVRIQSVPVPVGGAASVGAAGASLAPASGPGSSLVQPSLSGVGSVLPGASLQLPTPAIQAHPVSLSAAPALAPSARTEAAGAPAARSLPAVQGRPVSGVALPAPSAVPARARAAKPLKAAPKSLGRRIDFSRFTPASLGRMSASGAHAAGRWLMDKLLGVQSIQGSGSVIPAGPFHFPQSQGHMGFPGAAARPGGKTSPARLKPSKAAEKEYDPFDRPFTAWRMGMFEWNPEQYALTFMFGVEDHSPRGYELLVGLAVHEAMEKVYTWIKDGRSGRDITVREVLAEYEAAFRRGRKEARYKSHDGWRVANYKRRGRDFIRRRFELLYPFDDQGEVLALEERVLWDMKDPATGKTYKFKGKIDRLMLDGDTIVIHDWKTHFNPPSITHLMHDDYQLGLYALGLLRGRPDLVKGRKIKLVWDFKEFSQEILVDEAYLKGIEEKVFSILRRIDTFTARVEADRAEWEKRLRPDKRPKGLKKAKEQVDRIGELNDEISDKKDELRRLRKEYSKLEEGLARYAEEKGLSLVKGKRYSAGVEVKETKGAVPTKSDDPEEHEAVADILKKAGVWEKYSKLDASALKQMAEFQGGEDHAAYQRVKRHLHSAHYNGLVIQHKEDASGGIGGVARPKLPKDEWAPDAQPGLISPTQLSVFMKDPEDFVRRYIFRMRDAGPKPMGYLAGSVIHETMEQLFTWMKGGRPVKEITLADVLKFFDERWAELRKEDDYKADDGLTEADYKRGSKAYVRAKWRQFYPFDRQGRIIYLERRMHFTLTDPETGRVYKFQGIPDRVMLNGDTVDIRDWKSHYKPPSDEEVREKYAYQLALYVLAMRQLYPGLMKGRKARLIWDFKDKATVIEVDEAYLRDFEKKLFKTLRGMDALRAEVNAHREEWRERLRPVDVPGSKREAAARVDRMGKLADKIDRIDSEIKELKAESSLLESDVVDFSKRTGRTSVEGKSFVSDLKKYGYVAVPTKGKSKDAYEDIVRILKEEGVWEKYSSLDYTALKKALADPKNPDRGVLDRLAPYLKDVKTVKVGVGRTSDLR